MRDVLSKYRLGSPRTRKGYISVLKLVIKDFFYLHIFFNSFKELRFEQINTLIAHWKMKDIKNVTISSRLAILRKYTTLLNHSIVIPDNQSLGLRRVKNKIEQITPLSNKDIINNVYNPFTRLIINLQVHLGLTKNEAINFRLQPYGETKKQYYVAKAIAHDNRDRLIEIRFPEQEHVLEELSNKLDMKLSLSAKYHLALLTRVYTGELALAGYQSNYPFRLAYAQRLYKYLTTQEKLTEKEAINKIVLEMGVVETRIIKKWITYE